MIHRNIMTLPRAPHLEGSGLTVPFSIGLYQTPEAASDRAIMAIERGAKDVWIEVYDKVDDGWFHDGRCYCVHGMQPVDGKV